MRGARIPIRETEALFIGVEGQADDLNPRCAISWAGFRPYTDDVQAGQQAQWQPVPEEEHRPTAQSTAVAVTVGDSSQPQTVQGTAPDGDQPAASSHAQLPTTPAVALADEPTANTKASGSPGTPPAGNVDHSDQKGLRMTLQLAAQVLYLPANTLSTNSGTALFFDSAWVPGAELSVDVQPFRALFLRAGFSENVWVGTNNVLAGRLAFGVVAPFDWYALPWLSAGIAVTGRFSNSFGNNAGVGGDYEAGLDIPVSPWGVRIGLKYLPTSDLNFFALNAGVFRQF